MKSLHKIISKDSLRPALQYIQVKDGFAYATDTHAAAIAPVSEVLDNTVLPTEELYFNGQEWGIFKIFKAESIVREGQYFTAKNAKGVTLGTIKALTADEFKSIGKYPEVPSVFPTDREPQKLISIGINHKVYSNACEALGGEPVNIRCTFYGVDRAILLTTTDNSTKVILMPCYDRKNGY